MTKVQKILAAGACVLVLTVLVRWAWSEAKLHRLEKQRSTAEELSTAASRKAEQLQLQADQSEARASELEDRLAELQAAARRQDDEIDKAAADTNSARERYRRVRSAEEREHRGP